MDGAKRWYDAHGRLHRTDGPAIEHPDGSEEWYAHGRRHRDGDLPAIVRTNGDRYWYMMGVLHRQYKPAIIHASGIKMWLESGVFFRRDEIHCNVSSVFDNKRRMYGRDCRFNALPHVELPNGSMIWNPHRKDHLKVLVGGVWDRWHAMEAKKYAMGIFIRHVGCGAWNDRNVMDSFTRWVEDGSSLVKFLTDGGFIEL